MQRLSFPSPADPDSFPPQWALEGGYVFQSGQIDRVIAPATSELLGMCLDFVGRACRDERIMQSLGLPRDWWDPIAGAWQRNPQPLAMRFDFALDEGGAPKLLECNSENPGDLRDGARFQEIWLDELRTRGSAPDRVGQFNQLEAALVKSFARRAKDGPVGFVCDDTNAEDVAELSYLRECAARAGCQTQGLSIRQFSDALHAPAADLGPKKPRTVVKRVRWHTIAKTIPLNAVEHSGLVVLEPLWTLIMASKAMLAWLWQLHPGHPNLLPAWLHEDMPHPLPARHVIKPRISHRGHNVRIVADDLPDGGMESGGPFADAEGIVQLYQPLRRTLRGDGRMVYAILGSWVVDGQPRGIAVFEDTKPILMGDSLHFVPHLVLPD